MWSNFEHKFREINLLHRIAPLISRILRRITFDFFSLKQEKKYLSYQWLAKNLLHFIDLTSFTDFNALFLFTFILGHELWLAVAPSLHARVISILCCYWITIHCIEIWLAIAKSKQIKLKTINKLDFELYRLKIITQKSKFNWNEVDILLQMVEEKRAILPRLRKE